MITMIMSVTALLMTPISSSRTDLTTLRAEL